MKRSRDIDTIDLRGELKMLAQLLNRDFILESSELLKDLLSRPDVLTTRPGQPDLTPEDFEDACVGLAAAIAGEAEEAPADEDYRAFFPRDPMLALVQTALTIFYEDKHPEMIRKRGAGRSLTAGEVVVTDQELQGIGTSRNEAKKLFGAFEPADVGWAACLTAMAWRKLRGRRAFNPSPAAPVNIANNARVVLLGDWGSGLPRARKVAAAVRAELEAATKRDRHVVHLGDVYYSGWSREFKQHVIPHWPVWADEAASIGSWSLKC
jgi:hypothetical protein